jgi:hypothetical protein
MLATTFSSNTNHTYTYEKSVLNKSNTKMNNYADMTIHITQDLLPDNQKKLEEEVRVLEGVTAARFNYSMKHWLNVLYDPESTTPWTILKQVRQWDEDANFY